MKSAIDSLRLLYVLVLTLAVGAEASGAPGPQKKAEVVAQALVILDEPGGITIPVWLRPYAGTILGIIVDVAVTLLNKTGFFEPSKPS